MSEITNELDKNKSFGDKFFVKTNEHLFPSMLYDVVSKWIPIKSTQAIASFNYLEPYIRRGIMPEDNEKNNLNLLGLYSYIADRQYFEEDFFHGFISLKNYHHLCLYETYYNPEDKITIYVYLDEFNMKKDCTLHKVKPKKAYSFYPW